MNVTDKLKEIFVNIFSIEQDIINGDLSPDQVENWDSLQHLNLVLAIEEEFGIKISPEESTELLNFGMVVNHIQEKLNKAEKEASAS